MNAENDQDEVTAFLSRPETFGVAGPVERIETHISRVFIAGERVYKLKRAVRYSYLDFSTREARRRFCEAEVAVNRRTAPALYLGVAAVWRAGDGLRLGAPGDAPEGEVVDWLTVMRRFDQDKLFDRLAQRGALTPELVSELAEAIAGFHEAAEVNRSAGGAAGLGAVIAENGAELARHCPRVFDAARVEALTSAAEAMLARLSPVLERRREEGRVRRCHGDLHLRNICLWEGAPTLFDAVEFSEEIATVDVLFDLAFLVMDLLHRGHAGLAALVLSHTLGVTGDFGGLAAMPLFLSVRAAIRAHTTASAEAASPSPATAEEARAYLALAESLLRPGAPRLIAIGGLSGTGKSTVGRLLAPGFAPAPGAVTVRSDLTRKRLMGVPPRARLGPEGYAEAVTRRVYEMICINAGEALAGGYVAIADAVYAAEAERAAIRAVAERAGVPFAGLWLEAPASVRAARVGARTKDASDATPDLAAVQERYDIGAVGWARVDAAANAETVAARCRARIEA